MNLPIFASKELIVETVKNNTVTILVGETGSGKTTQLPIFLYEAGLINGGILGITQPRRIAAISVAEFVTSQLGGSIGDVVGYQIRFDDQTADSTKIKFMTDGILLRELQVDPNLSKYFVIIVDEAHERSQNVDFVLGLLKDLLGRRKDLKVVVTSATIDEQKFSRYFWNAPIVNVSGRTFPVEIVWSPEDCYQWETLLDNIVEKVIDIHFNGDHGDILVFVTGIDDINKLIDKIEEKKISDIILLPAHGSLDPDEQRKIFEIYPGKRKVVVATNIAETSITLDNTVYVIDSGHIKQTNFHPDSGIQSLDSMEHSQAGCEQRKGRAGRTQSGVCHRMYTQYNFEQRQSFTTPEIMRTSLANIVLVMEDIGIKNIKGFDFVDKPDEAAFIEAYETLIALGAIKKGERGLTELGRSMAMLPLEPRIARMLLEAEKHGCVQEVVIIAAFLSARNVFSRPRGKEREADAAHSKFKNPESDVLTFLRIWEEYEVVGRSNAWCFENFLNSKTLQEISKIREQIIDILFHNGINISSKNPDPDKIMKAVAMGLVYNLFIFTTFGRFAYQGVLRGFDVFIHPGSSVFGYDNIRCFVAAKVVQTKKNYAQVVTKVQVDWLSEMIPDLCTYGQTKLFSYEKQQKVVIASRGVMIEGRLMGEEKILLSIAEADILQRELVKKAEEKGWILLNFKKSGSGYFDAKAVATHRGMEVKAWSGEVHQIEEGVTYFCVVDDFLGEMLARPKFKVLDLSTAIDEEQSEVTDEQPQVVDEDILKKLAQKWGKNN